MEKLRSKTLSKRRNLIPQVLGPSVSLQWWLWKNDSGRIVICQDVVNAT